MALRKSGLIKDSTYHWIRFEEPTGDESQICTHCGYLMVIKGNFYRENRPERHYDYEHTCIWCRHDCSHAYQIRPDVREHRRECSRNNSPVQRLYRRRRQLKYQFSNIKSDRARSDCMTKITKIDLEIREILKRNGSDSSGVNGRSLDESQ